MSGSGVVAIQPQLDGNGEDLYLFQGRDGLSWGAADARQPETPEVKSIAIDETQCAYLLNLLEQENTPEADRLRQKLST